MFEKFGEFKKDNLFSKTKKYSKFFGKYLGNIIASQTIFNGKSISVIGFSLGCNVIKLFLKEIYKIYLITNNEDLLMIINNVIFIAGATTLNKIEKWNLRFLALVSGKVINIHSNYDIILKVLFKTTTEKTAIGYDPLIYDRYLNNFYNVDFTCMKIGHTEYRSNLGIVAEVIKHRIKII